MQRSLSKDTIMPNQNEQVMASCDSYKHKFSTNKKLKKEHVQPIMCLHRHNHRKFDTSIMITEKLLQDYQNSLATQVHKMTQSNI